jgi:hypothetical protein
MVGAMKLTERSTSCPAATLGIDCGEVALIRSPLSNISVYPDQEHAPAFFSRQVFVKEAPGVICDPSGMDTSRTNCA